METNKMQNLLNTVVKICTALADQTNTTICSSPIFFSGSNHKFYADKDPMLRLQGFAIECNGVSETFLPSDFDDYTKGLSRVSNHSEIMGALFVQDIKNTVVNKVMNK